ncbi:MAG: cytochrome P450 [Allosphingosinicella sp.]
MPSPFLPLPKARLADTLRVALLAAGPLFAKGLLLRRPAMLHGLARSGAEARGVALLARLRRRYGDGPLRLRFPFREIALILAPDDLRRVLAGTPAPFAPDSPEKRAALAHFQPKGVLISSGGERARRRAFNEAVLETGRRDHKLAPALQALVARETAPLIEAGAFGWPTFRRAWYRMVRQALFGAPAREAEALTATLDRLRADANWAFLKPVAKRVRDRFLADIRARMAAAPADSLGGLAMARAVPGDAPEHQAAHWLFAFDAAGIAGFRALVMLALHPDAAARARGDDDFRRVCLLETLRLWPTTPAILRRTTEATDWNGRRLAADAGLLIHLPYFHRDDSRIPYAHRFVPEVWLDGRAEAWPFVPFSAGEAGCPARELVLHVAGRWLGACLESRAPACDVRLDPHRLPATLDHTPLRLALRPLARAAAEPASARPVDADA